MKSKSLFKILSLIFSLFFFAFLTSGDASGALLCYTCGGYDGYNPSGQCASTFERLVGSTCKVSVTTCMFWRDYNYNPQCSSCEYIEYNDGVRADCGAYTGYSYWGDQSFCGSCGKPTPTSPLCNKNCWAPNGTRRCPNPPATKNGLSCYFQPILGYSVCRTPQCSGKSDCVCNVRVTSVLTDQSKPTTLPVLINNIGSTVKKYFFK